MLPCYDETRTLEETGILASEMKTLIKNKTEELLSKEYFCSLGQLKGTETVYSLHPAAKQPFIKILAYRNCVVVCTSEGLHQEVRELLCGKNRDEIFDLPLIYGQTIHYVPDSCAGHPQAPSNYTFEFFFGENVLSLRGLTGFENSLPFDEKGNTLAGAVYLARSNGWIIGAAGAAASSAEGMWEVGVDVLEGYRKAGLGTCLVKGLTGELLARRIVPFYSASVTNIGSQMVASRCGYIPSWVDTFGTVFDGNCAYKSLVSGLFPQAVQ